MQGEGNYESIPMILSGHDSVPTGRVPRRGFQGHETLQLKPEIL